MPMPGGRGAADDLVVDVGDVHHPGDREAAVAQVANEEIGVQEAPEVADVDGPVDGRAAAVDPDVLRLEGLERPRLAGQRVVEADAHGIRSSDRDRGCRDAAPGTLHAARDCRSTP